MTGKDAPPGSRQGRLDFCGLCASTGESRTDALAETLEALLFRQEDQSIA